MNREELKIFINEIRKNIDNKHLSIFIKRYYKDEYQQIINETNYLNNCKFTEQIYYILNDLYEIPKCKECGDNVKFLSIETGYQKFCGLKCSTNNKEVKDKSKKTNREKLGVDYPSQSEEVRKKSKETCLINHGVENPSQSEKIQKKKRERCLKNHGVEYPSQSEKVKEKGKQNNFKKYGVEYPLQNKEIKEKRIKIKLKNEYNKLFNTDRLKGLVIPLFTVGEYKGTKMHYYSFQCATCGDEFEDDLTNGRMPRCRVCNPPVKFTKPHKKVCRFLNENNINHEIEKYIKPYSVDIFINFNKIIEIYGDYWHGNPKFYNENDIIKFPNKNILMKDKWEYDEKRINYLSNKHEVLIIWEDEIKNDWDNVKNRIFNYLKQ